MFKGEGISKTMNSIPRQMCVECLKNMLLKMTYHALYTLQNLNEQVTFKNLNI